MDGPQTIVMDGGRYSEDVRLQAVLYLQVTVKRVWTARGSWRGVDVSERARGVYGSAPAPKRIFTLAAAAQCTKVC